MPGPKPPEVQIGDLVAFAFNRGPDLLGKARIRRSVEQDSAGIAYETNRPARNYECADKACEWVHPEPAEGARKQQAHDHKHRDGGICGDMDDGRAHVVVAVLRVVIMIVVIVRMRLVVGKIV